MNPEFYSIEMIVRQWIAGAQGKAPESVSDILSQLAEENNQ